MDFELWYAFQAPESDVLIFYKITSAKDVVDIPKKMTADHYKLLFCCTGKDLNRILETL